MKSWIQTLILLVVFMALLAGVTFVSQSIRSKSAQVADTPQTPAVARPTVRLSFVDLGTRPIEQYEAKTTGHEDFWFDNPNPGPVELRADVKNCQCSRVEVVVLTPQEKKRLPHWPPAASTGGAGPGDPPPGPKKWQRLEDEQTITIQPNGAGAIRLAWQTKKLGPERVALHVWTQRPGEPASRADTNLSRDLDVVPPVLARSSEAGSGDLGLRDLEAGSEASGGVLCWSPTRRHFNLEAVVEMEDGHVADPHFKCTQRPMTDREREGLAGKLRSLTREKKVASGYVVTVEALEQLGPKQRMPLGPYRRRLLLRSKDTGGEAIIEVHGRVRGDVQVGGDEDRGSVELGNFRVGDGATKTIVLETARADLGLREQDHRPGFLDVRLGTARVLPGGGKRWQLTVAVAPDREDGPLPRGSEVVLQTVENVPRLIHIPVRGAGYR
jgi:hypothetical protein